MDTSEQSEQGAFGIACVKQVVEDLAQSRHRITLGKFRVDERAFAEGCPRGYAPGESDHRAGAINTEDVVTFVTQSLRPHATAASDVNYQAITNATAPQRGKEPRRRVSREIGEACMMNIGQIRLVACHLFLFIEISVDR